MIVKAAVVQLGYYPGDKSRSLDRIEEMLDECAGWGVNLVCLQEYALTGYPKSEWAETIPGPSTDRLGGICKRHGIYLAAGSILERDRDKLYNTVPLIGPGGEVRHDSHRGQDLRGHRRGGYGPAGPLLGGPVIPGGERPEPRGNRQEHERPQEAAR